MLSNQTYMDAPRIKNVSVRNISLSTYFPEGTQFYYGYPAGEDSGFLNTVTPVVEELVAARPLCCAGPSVSVVCFSATSDLSIDKDLAHILALPRLNDEQTIVLPESIGPDVAGKDRNDAIKHALLKLIKPGSFIMAQPYTEPNLAHLYQIPPHITSWLNDKGNMANYISSELLPKRYGIYKHGVEFAKDHANLQLPVVVKASSSSSGDGVHICLTQEDLNIAAEKLSKLSGSVLAEQYIHLRKNYGIHFGIPWSRDKPIDLLGINEQLVTNEGAFMGGVIESTDVPDELQETVDYLLNVILPKVRDMGWYGIGGFDVLVDQSGQTYFIDCNFRMTGMTAYHFLIANGAIRAPIFSFSAEFKGDKEALVRCLQPYVGGGGRDNFLHLISLSNHDKVWRFNGALSFTTIEEQRARAKLLLDHGVESTALSMLG